MSATRTAPPAKELFRELGGILKEGLGRDWGNRDRIADLCAVRILKGGKDRLNDPGGCVAAMPAERKPTSSSSPARTGQRWSAARALEAYRHRGWDVLLLARPHRRLRVPPGLPDYKGEPVKAADRHAPGELQRGWHARWKKQPHLPAAAGRAQGDPRRGGRDLGLSKRLKEDAACLVADEGALDAHVERLMQRLRARLKPRVRRILELEAEHPAVQGLLRLHSADPADPRIEAHAHLLHAEAVLRRRLPASPTPRTSSAASNELLVKDSSTPRPAKR